ncbi:P-loop containing nucleoside triphosphate hydrolase protein [Xylaria bambusicola]|uniref:P-loop containing nucleoside triphosphate hydrolase protein n=1 Tax=Xylaria bambusicola TaxID=326684 RepID=UPI002008633B|nr:P-loop containing nucleoside triphosphate hydrolase protein [Xylaria bambusicola]KAI0509260.1 P-loop containing nucleoside triphosphate hydrolase protein [Xylaria bambusicola]
MPPRCPSASAVFLPFLYPALFRSLPRVPRAGLSTSTPASTSATEDSSDGPESLTTNNTIPISRLNPSPDDYAISSFADKAKITILAGGGGHGCISFLREAFLANGPANGGDGGHGGNIYIQAVQGENSLHKLARRRIIRAGRGKTGQGSNRGGARGEDVIIQVPIGTVVREIDRIDPMVEENILYHQAREKEREYEKLVREAEAAARVSEETGLGESEALRLNIDLPEPPEHPNAHKFVLYPGMSSGERRNLSLPRLPMRERLFAQPDSPIHLDLSIASPRPILLAAGGLGGLGNPHFVSKDRPRPLFATKGERAIRMQLDLELKLLADLGFVGLPNAGKSTLLRALTRSRARVGNWAFTTLQPNIGTVVLDNHKGRPIVKPKPAVGSSPSHSVIHDATFGSVVVSQQPGQIQIGEAPEPRKRFTIADIPGLIEGAHLDRGLGIEFLRHVERAGVLAFVIDLNAGNAVKALKSLWTEVGLYARMREDEERERETSERIDWQGDGANLARGRMVVADLPEPVTQPTGLHIASKPWFVIATKSDLPETEENFNKLKTYLDAVTDGKEPHPSNVEHAWTEDCVAIPVSAIHGQGVDRIIHWTLGLLDN